MQLPERRWYGIKDLAEKFGCSESDIKHYLRIGELLPAFELVNVKARIKDPPDVGREVPLSGTYHLLCAPHFSEKEGTKNIQGEWVIPTAVPTRGTPVRYEILEPCPIDFNDLLISREVLIGFGVTSENNSEDILLSPEQKNQALIPRYLDPKHPYFSPEIEAAVSAWIALYDSGEYQNYRGHLDQITKWVQMNRKEQNFTAEAIKRIASVVNPNKKGGAPRR